MILYHGSNTIIEKIDLSKSKPNKDFGKAVALHERNYLSICVLYPKGHRKTEKTMNVTQKDFEFMVDIMTRDIIALLMERHSIDMKSAFDVFYNSDTYTALIRPESGLYFQSPKYVYSILDNEMKTGKMG